jgi:hypothetical protein
VRPDRVITRAPRESRDEGDRRPRTSGAACDAAATGRWGIEPEFGARHGVGLRCAAAKGAPGGAGGCLWAATPPPLANTEGNRA